MFFVGKLSHVKHLTGLWIAAFATGGLICWAWPTFTTRTTSPSFLKVVKVARHHVMFEDHRAQERFMLWVLSQLLFVQRFQI